MAECNFGELGSSQYDQWSCSVVAVRDLWDLSRSIGPCRGAVSCCALHLAYNLAPGSFAVQRIVADSCLSFSNCKFLLDA